MFVGDFEALITHLIETFFELWLYFISTGSALLFCFSAFFFLSCYDLSSFFLDFGELRRPAQLHQNKENDKCNENTKGDSSAKIETYQKQKSYPK